MLAIIDNYDSFTYNLVQCFGELGADVRVYRNDQISVDDLKEQRPAAIVISPGPCTPNEAGISGDVIRQFAGELPILGVCLGHQCIAQVFGCRVGRADRLMHGKTSPVYHDGSALYHGIPSPFTTTRYHSLIVDRSTLRPELHITAWTVDGEIMGLRHTRYDIEGVQFHPESILTEWGPVLLANFLRRAGIRVNESASKPRVPVKEGNLT